MKKSIPQNNQVKSKRYLTFWTMIIICLDLFFLYISKYNRKNLSITEFNPDSFGNILNFFFFLIPMLGLIVLFFKTKSVDKKYYFALLSMSIIITLPLIVTVILKEMKISVSNSYLWDYSVEKIFTAILFIFYQYLLIMLGIFTWLLIFKAFNKAFIRSLLYSVLIIVLLIAVAFFYSNDGTNLKEYYKTGKHSDVAVILGAAVWSKTKPSPLFASRICKANNLYSAGITKKLQVTGGSAPGEQSEAKVAYNFLIKCGVDPQDIWMEDKSSSTSEQIAFIKERLVEEKKMKNILIVTDEFHIKRVKEICKFYNVKAEGIASDLKLSWGKSLVYKFRDSLALLLFWLFAI
jgi:uncharacterized SAM-binding protein YcdF (DUF218 family)